ncbi:MAG: VTT domain-containing protein [Candidatus Omnitrophica bacterium]|nr:VTT domain-containing protein [Candidatus Omnitrophota bacterium]
MEHLKDFLDIFLHLDHSISHLSSSCGNWTYVIVFAVIFCETGLVVLPFLPGDSLLFVLGALAANHTLNLEFLWVLLCAAAILGNMLNYFVGTRMVAVIQSSDQKLIKPEHIQRTHAFFETYGPKAIILTRFLPILRTIAPFLAGAGKMEFKKFALYNLAGGLLWVSVGLGSGWWFGNLPWVAKNFSVVILAIVVISLIPAVYEYLKHKNNK